MVKAVYLSTDFLCLCFSRDCVIVVQSSGRTQYQLGTYGVVRLGECLRMDLQELEILSGFRTRCKPSQQGYMHEVHNMFL